MNNEFYICKLKDLFPKLLLLTLIFAVSVGHYSCVESTDNQKVEVDIVELPSQKIVNKLDETKFPNDKSELAFYMRNLYNDLKANKKRIKNGEEALEVEWAMKYANLITVTPTDSKNSGPVFEAFAGKFMLDLKAYQDADKNGNLEIYNGMIQSCLNCHAQYCKGPMGAIRKLKM